MKKMIQLAVVVLLLASSNVHAVSKGGELFQQNCMHCHTNGPAAFRTSHENIPALLRSGQIRKHRFTLSDKEIEQIMLFISQ